MTVQAKATPREDLPLDEQLREDLFGAEEIMFKAPPPWWRATTDLNTARTALNRLHSTARALDEERTASEQRLASAERTIEELREQLEEREAFLRDALRLYQNAGQQVLTRVFGIESIMPPEPTADFAGFTVLCDEFTMTVSIVTHEITLDSAGTGMKRSWEPDAGTNMLDAEQIKDMIVFREQVRSARGDGPGIPEHVDITGRGDTELAAVGAGESSSNSGTDDATD